MSNNQPSLLNSTANMAVDMTQARRLGELLQVRGERLLTVESCTGGMLAAFLTSLPGSSNWFEGAFVTYRLRAKTQMVGVRESVLERFGAVSEPTARAMAEGALRVSDADLSVAITGVAGPDGGGAVIPVGTVWFAWASRQPEIECVHSAQHDFTGDRQGVRVQAVNVAVSGLIELLQ